ncbi:calcium-binding protein [Phenylobacterium sp.]|jgi:Ca2+-binding RTX toxin-like protein|uniref:calcium-binding protein n=1 Tax=Phenylobacterium sp. TaxID=1871053 RepID=UPI002F94E692
MPTLTINDDVFTGSSGNDTVYALAGNDQVNGGAGNDIIEGHEGHDILRGQDGDDTLDGGADDDFLHGGLGADLFIGGAGWDRVAFSSGATHGATVYLITPGAQATGYGNDEFLGIEHLSGTRFNDVFWGTASANWIWGGSDGSGVTGNDTLVGDAGDDLIEVGAGDHLLNGGDDYDVLSFFGNGSDITSAGVVFSLAQQHTYQATQQGSMYAFNFEGLSGSFYADTLSGDGGDNYLAGSLGDDQLYGDDGDDVLLGDGQRMVDTHGIGGSGPIVSYDDRAAVFGETPGNDYLDAGDGNDYVNGGGGDDFVRAGKGDDEIDGADGHDYLRGDAGKDVIKAGDGDDLLYGNADDDELHGEDGWDRAAYASGATAGVKVDLNLQGTWQDTGSQGYDYLTGIEHLSGTIFDDELIGDEGANWIWGGSNTTGVTGNDVIHAGKGDDLVEVGTGDHYLDGGDDVDVLSFFGNATDITSAGVEASLALQGSVQWTLQGNMEFKGFEGLSGSIYDDKLSGDGDANLLAGAAGGDYLDGAEGDDTLLGDGHVRAYSHGTGTSGPIVTDIDVTWNGSSFPGGADTLDGGKGNDSLTGGVGADVLWGAGGEDHFVYTRAEDSKPTDRDLIMDLEKWDVIDLSGIDADVTTTGDDAFTLVAAFGGTAGEATLAYDAVTDITSLSLDVDGDGRADTVVDIRYDWSGFGNFIL